MARSHRLKQTRRARRIRARKRRGHRQMPRHGLRNTNNLRRSLKPKSWRMPKWRPRLFSYRKGRRL